MSGSIQRRHSSAPANLAEINVTPLVDVMLVLLIIFMVSAPLMQQGLTVDLPKAKGEGLAQAQDRVVLTLTRSQLLQWNGETLALDLLPDRLATAAAANPDVRVYVQADEQVPYGQVAALVAEAKTAGVKQVGLVTREPDRRRAAGSRSKERP